MLKPSRSRATADLAMASLFIALALSTNYLLINIPNVKLMDTLVFIASCKIGITWGALVAAITWIVYGTLNPYGTNMITLAIVITGELLFVVAGFAVSKINPPVPRPLLFGLVGGLFTLAYDIYTNALTGILFYGSLWAGLVTMNFPLPMGIAHEVSNIVFFAIATPLLLKLLEKRQEMRGGETKNV